MSLLTVLAGNYLGGIAERASNMLLDKAQSAMAERDFDTTLRSIEKKKLTLNDLPLNPEEKAEILDLINIAKQGDMESFELEIHGQMFMLNTSNLELTPSI